ncbi:MAG: hypothetical protein C4532_11615 [Candidatus Abyssobacteria bacterium SURF_17]|uniref:Uncharacterized protein n=1 Tax=Candidatus Abyssobacteria bacterium SURF_17 TaxID=2093361 RepID=A0A419EWS5_9BACT|nr:MAG: hypothetical protein C4532_11615 [Candidatus Abyssubacteria bacterium SURF_17]
MAVPIKCSNCGTRVTVLEGGLCNKCEKFFCHSCLFLEKDRKERVLVCTNCREADKKYTRLSRSIPSTVDARRRYVKRGIKRDKSNT